MYSPIPSTEGDYDLGQQHITEAITFNTVLNPFRPLSATVARVLMSSLQRSPLSHSLSLNKIYFMLSVSLSLLLLLLLLPLYVHGTRHNDRIIVIIILLCTSVCCSQGIIAATVINFA